jgi:D-alanine-D-alanine ligase
MNKKQVCVLFGGVSSEYEVSLRSAASVLRHMDREAYDIHMLGITRDGRWLSYTGPIDLIESDGWHRSPYARRATLSPDRAHGGILLFPGKTAIPHSQRIRQRLMGGDEPQPDEGALLPVDVVFPVLHGKNGEDGTVQGLLELAGIPYVGCGVLASAACMDKEVTHHLLQSAGIPKTKLIGLRRDDVEDFRILETRLSSELGYPLFVKPANAGSSVGITKVKSPDMLEKALEDAFLHDDKLVVEQAVIGKEVECAVLGNRGPLAAEVVGEVAPAHDFYDYAGKYLDDSTALYIPATISPTIAQKVREIAVAAYKIMGCRGLARVDFFVRGDGEIILNEINTLPGFTSISMYPKLFEASGLSYSQLIDKLIAYALEK